MGQEWVSGKPAKRLYTKHFPAPRQPTQNSNNRLVMVKTMVKKPAGSQ